jgi:hypothetical protein
MLLPALNKARRAANTVACLSQLRQIGQAVYMYTTQYQGKFPPLGAGEGSANIARNQGFGWQKLLYPYVTGKTLPDGYANQFSTALTDPLANSPGTRLFICPSYEKLRMVGDAQRIPTTYVYNYGSERYGSHEGAISWQVPNPDPLKSTRPLAASKRLGRVQQAQNFILVSETNQAHAWGGADASLVSLGAANRPAHQAGATGGPTNLTVYGQTLHGGKASDRAKAKWNYLFADGHADTLSPFDTVNMSIVGAGRYVRLVLGPLDASEPAGMWTISPND